MSTIGAVIAVDSGLESLYSYEEQNTAVRNVLFYTGLAGMIGSIPLFIAAKKNKRIGMSLFCLN